MSDRNLRQEDYRSDDLRDSPMMSHLIETMEKGEDVGHYGRLVFTMVAQYFMEDDEIVNLLAKQPDVSEKEARIQLVQVKERGYNPPHRNTILEWQEMQDFQICPNPDDPNACNVYRELRFPEEIYENIEGFWEQKLDAQE